MLTTFLQINKSFKKRLVYRQSPLKITFPSLIGNYDRKVKSCNYCPLFDFRWEFKFQLFIEKLFLIIHGIVAVKAISLTLLLLPLNPIYLWCPLLNLLTIIHRLLKILSKNSPKRTQNFVPRKGIFITSW